VKQQCHLSMIWLSWAVYIAGLAGLVWMHQWILAAAWLIAVPLAQALYVRKFPAFSSAMGYGLITDRPAPPLLRASSAPAAVTLYTALGCPFCPLMEQRLESLRASLGFTLRKIDVTLRPDLLSSRKILSVPAVEINGRILTGLIGSEDLAAAIAQPEVTAVR
jgi:glutaredoxin